MFGFGEIATALATWYGYKTLAALVIPNFGLIVALMAFIFGCLVLIKVLNQQYPRIGRNPFKKWIVFFVISSVFFIFAFTLFYEKKKLEDVGSLKHSPGKIHNSNPSKEAGVKDV